MIDHPEIATVVEGHAEVESLPILIRRIAAEIPPAVIVTTPRPIRIPKSRLMRSGELERAVRLAASRVPGPGGVLVLLDADEDCPAHLGPTLLSRATAAVGGSTAVAVVLAKAEFEAWFLASAGSLRGIRGLPDDLSAPLNPEGIRGAKEWLRAQMGPGDTYSPVVDQPAMTAQFDLQAAERSESFEKCLREINNFLGR